MNREPLLRAVAFDALQAMDAIALRAALQDALNAYSCAAGDQERLIPIGLRLAAAGRQETASEAIDWAEAAPKNERTRALGFLLQGMWDAFEPTSRVFPVDVKRAIALRASARPDATADHELLMALAATLADPLVQQLVLPVLDDALARSSATETRSHQLLAAAVRTYQARGTRT